MKKINLLGCTVFFFISIPLHAASCNLVTKQIGDDIAKYGLSIKNQRLAWKDLSWLLTQLGEPQTHPVAGRLDQWDKFSLLTRSDGLKLAIGEFPVKQESISLEKAVELLGPPKQSYSETMAQYSWKCTDGSSLTAMIGNGGILLSVMLTSCQSGTSCRIQSSILEKSELESKLNQVATPSVTVPSVTVKEQSKVKGIIAAYNDHYHESLQTEIELQEKLIDKYKNYYANLRLCQPGAYSFAYVYPFTKSLIYPSVVIQKLSTGSCAVEVKQQIEGMGDIISKCQYLPEQLVLFTDQEAESSAKGDISYDSNNLTPLQKVQKTQCQMYMNGEKVDSF